MRIDVRVHIFEDIPPIGSEDFLIGGLGSRSIMAELKRKTILNEKFDRTVPC